MGCIDVKYDLTKPLNFSKCKTFDQFFDKFFEDVSDKKVALENWLAKEHNLEEIHSFLIKMKKPSIAGKPGKYEDIPSNFDEFKELVESKFLGETQNEDEESVMDSSSSLNQTLTELFGEGLPIENSTRLRLFKQEIFEALRIMKDPLSKNTHKSVQDSKDLNVSLFEYRQRQFKILEEVLEKRIPDFKKEELFIEDDSKKKKFNRKYYQYVINTFNNEVIDKLNQSVLSEEYYNYLENRNLKNTPNLYSVLSYLNLVYFDESIKKVFNKKISIAQHLYDEEQGLFDADGNILIKYIELADNSHVKNSWVQGDFDDITKLTSDDSKILISSLLIKDYETGEIVGADVYITSISQAMSNLKRALINYTGSDVNLIRAKRAVLTIDDNPNENINQIFQNIFKGGRYAKIKDLNISRNESNILYSIFNQIMQGDNARSIYQVVENDYKKIGQINQKYKYSDLIYHLLQRNNAITYITTSRDDNGEFTTRYLVKSEVVRRKLLGKKDELFVKLNTSGQQEKRNILEKYNFKQIRADVIQITLNGVDYQIFTNGNSLGISGGHHEIHIAAKLDDSITSYIRRLINTSDLTKNEKDILNNELRSNPFSNNILTFIRQKDSNNTELIELLEHGSKESIDGKLGSSIGTNIRKSLIENDPKYSDLKALLQFISDVLNLDFQTSIGLQTLSYYVGTKGESLRPLLSSAASMLYKQNILLQYDEGDKEKSLKRFISEDCGDPIFGDMEHIIISNGREVITPVNTTDWMDNFYSAESMILGDATKSVTKDAHGNGISNYRPACLGNKFHEEMEQRRKYSGQSALDSNLCVNEKTNFVTDVVVDTTFESREGLHDVKGATTSELLYHGIVNNFFNAYLSEDGQRGVFIQPTVYSDKTTFLNYRCDLSKKLDLRYLGLSKQKTLLEFTTEEYESIFEHTTIQYFKKQYENILNDWRRLFNDDTLTDVQINNILKTLNTDSLESLIRKYNQEHPDNLIVIKEHTHYRGSKSLSLNEISVYYSSSDYDVKFRLDHEKREFIDLLFDNNITFNTYKNSVLDKIIHNKDFVSDIKSFKDNWVQNNELVIARYIDEEGNVNIIQNQHQLQQASKYNIELNPLLEKYFYIDLIASSNIKYALVGNEISDPNKAAKIKLNEEFKFIPNVFPVSENALKFIQNTDLATIKFLLDGTLTADTKEEIDAIIEISQYKDYIRNKYNDILYRIIAATEGAQYKRNVIMPATGDYVHVGEFHGVPNKWKVAFVDDPQAQVNNLSGENKSIDANDGGAKISPLAALCQNGSLGENLGNYYFDKPIWYYYDPILGTSGLMKFATHTITNSQMELSLDAKQNQYKVFKKMHNKHWKGTINILKSDHKNGKGDLDFSSAILGNLGGPLLYETSEGSIQEISNLEKIDGIYYTTETSGIRSDKGYYLQGETKLLVAHLFDKQSNDLKIQQKEGESKKDFINRVNSIKATYNLDTIDSLFELHQALGGVSSRHLENGVLTTSENSLFALKNFLDQVTVAETDEKGEVHYTQPLKTQFIAYICYKSANKRDTSNINSVKSLEDDDTELLYSEIETRGWSRQQDSTHSVEESHLREMSQVIASLDVGGRMHPIAKLAFKDLAKVTMLQISELRDKLIDYIYQTSDGKFNRDESENYLYDLFVNDLINHGKPRNSRDFFYRIIQEVKKEFNNNESHQLDNFKLPISDANIFQQAVTSFVTQMNNIIKRDYPGTGDVMSPGYDVAMFHHYDGKTMLFDDIFHEAIESQGLITPSEPYQKSWNNGNSVNTSEAVFFSVDPLFEFNPNAVGNERYGGNRGFELVKWSQPGDPENIYEIHFKGDLERPFTELEKTQLLLSIQKYLPIGAKVILNGEVSKGGFSGFNRLLNYGFVPSTERVNGNWTKFKNQEDLSSVLSKYSIYSQNEDGSIQSPVLVLRKGLNDQQKKQLIVNAYLQDLQNSTNEDGTYVYDRDATWFQPTDIVSVLQIDEFGKRRNLMEIDLSEIDTYFDYKKIIKQKNSLRTSLILDLAKRLEERGINKTPEAFRSLLKELSNNEDYINLYIPNISTEKISAYNWLQLIYEDNLIYQENIIKPKNLRPQRTRFQLQNGEYANIYDLDGVVAMHEARRNKVKEYNKMAMRQEINRQNELLAENGIATINGEEIPIIPGSIETEVAEMMMTDLNKLSFGTKAISLNDQSKEDTIKQYAVQNVPNVDLILVGKHTTGVIIDGKLPKGLTYKPIKFKEVVTLNDGVKEIWNTNDQGEKLYQVGIQEDYSDEITVEVDGGGSPILDEKNNYIFKDKEGNIISDSKDLVYSQGKVFKKKYFVEYIKGMTDEGKAFYYYKFNNNDSKYIADTLKKIKTIENYQSLQLNEHIRLRNKDKILNILDKFDTSEQTYFNRVINGTKNYLKHPQYLPQKKTYINVYKDSGVQELQDGTKKKLNYSTILKGCREEMKKAFKGSRDISLKAIVARIPAQSLQSYMSMKCVGFLHGNDNRIIVSHFQTYLQGSDYDIDKAYVMNFSFDENGEFVKWSPIFDFTSEETIQASFHLPTPNRTYTEILKEIPKDGNYLDISEQIKTINDLWNNNRAEAIKELAKLIELIDEHSQNHRIKIYTSEPDTNYIISKIQHHERYFDELDLNKILNATKNAVSARIHLIVTDPKNMMAAYSPIDMSDLQSVKTPKSNLVSKLTGFNPATKFIMTNQNMEGKTVIGIAAVGEKVFMGLTYYMNEGIRSNDDVWQKRMMFTHQSTRIKGRSSGQPLIRTVTQIADLNWNLKNLSEEELLSLKQKIAQLQTNYPGLESNIITEADLMISQLLSAATDNAKELILSKINAGSKLAGIYLHLLILGYDIKDIVSFMTSPAISVVASLMNSNIYDSNYPEMPVKTALNLLKSGYSANILQLDNNLVERYDQVGINLKASSEFKKALYKALTEVGYDVSPDFMKMNQQKIWEYLLSINKNILNQAFDYMKENVTMFTNLNHYLNLISNLHNKITSSNGFNLDEFFADINELSDIQEQASETTTLGQMFGWNREIKPNFSEMLNKYVNLESKINQKINRKFQLMNDNGEGVEVSLKQILNNENIKGVSNPTLLLRQIAAIIKTEKPWYTIEEITRVIIQASDIIKNGFNFEKFISNEIEYTYQQNAINLYDLMKSQYNILDIITKSPQYYATLKAWDTSLKQIIQNNVKGKGVYFISRILSQQDIQLEEAQYGKLSGYMDDLLIRKYLEKHPFIYKVRRDDSYLDSYMQVKKYTTNQIVKIKDSYDLASFKIWFEQNLISSIASGELRFGDQIITIDSKNPLRTFLTYKLDKGQGYLGVNLLVDLLDQNQSTDLQYAQIIKGIRDIDKQMTDVKLSDLLALYNLIVLHNAPGNDRLSFLFSNLMTKDSLLYNYEHWLGEQDNLVKRIRTDHELEAYLKDELGFNLEDAKFKISKRVSEYTLHKKDSYKIKNSYPVVLVRKSNGSLAWQRLNEKRNYVDFDFGFMRGLSEHQDDRMFNFIQYNTCYLPTLDRQSKIVNNINKSNIQDVKSAIKLLVDGIKVKIKKIC